MIDIKHELIELLPENYYSSAADLDYISASQLKQFQNCEAAAMAALQGEVDKPAPSTALLVGSYVDAALGAPGELDAFLTAHPEIINSRTGCLKADFQRAGAIVDRCKSDRLFRALTADAPDSCKQVILSGAIAGAPFKGKADYLYSVEYLAKLAEDFAATPWEDYFRYAASCGGLLADLKTAADTAEQWDADLGERVPWATAWHYPRQLAIYRELNYQRTGHTVPCLLLVASKEPATSLLALTVGAGDLDEALADAMSIAPRVQSVKDGVIQPESCGHCAYCRSVRRLDKMGPVDFRFAADF